MKKTRRPRGMTLIEIVVVIAITTMLMSAVGLYAIGQWRESQVNVARTELKTLEAGLDTYLALTGRYPDPAQGFTPLLERRVLKEPPVDPWGNPFIWTLIAGTPVITSFGADGEPGGDSFDADLVIGQRAR
ncbi:MAG: type II secretion system protein GspG [Myxococcales bacterium]|nr:type II secretion system protein GspG [Myxococcales bacterium]MDP3503970.1 type II secretion system protein GspG [Myxococcales bacterium]